MQLVALDLLCSEDLFDQTPLFVLLLVKDPGRLALARLAAVNGTDSPG